MKAIHLNHFCVSLAVATASLPMAAAAQTSTTDASDARIYTELTRSSITNERSGSGKIGLGGAGVAVGGGTQSVGGVHGSSAGFGTTTTTLARRAQITVRATDTTIKNTGTQHIGSVTGDASNLFR